MRGWFSPAGNAHFPDIVFLIILKDIFLTIISQHREAQGFRFLPAGHNLGYRAPGPLPPEPQRPVMQAMTGRGFHGVGQSIDSWLIRRPIGRKS